MGNLLPFQRPPDQDGLPTRPCSRCGRSMLADAVRCRHCGEPVRFGGKARRERLPAWMVVGVILALAVLLGWALGR